MNQIAIFWPMLVQVALTFVVYAVLSRQRFAAIGAGEARAGQFRENRNEPERSLFARNNLVNQFELPVLFYACCLSLYAVASADLVAVVLAWIFAVSRVAHAWVHISTNRLRYRRPLFVVSFLALILMWAWFALHIAQTV